MSQSGCQDVHFMRILTGTNHRPRYATFASLQAGMGSIAFGINPFNSDLAGMPLRLLRLLSVVYSVFVIMLPFYFYVFTNQ